MSQKAKWRFANPDDPHTFFNCDWGHGSLMYCPGDLIFYEACDCCDYVKDPWHLRTTTTTTKNTGPTTTTTKAPNVCEGKNGRFANPDDPHTFFNCDWGHGSLMYCPEYLIFYEACDCCDYVKDPWHLRTTTTTTKNTGPTTTTTKDTENVCEGKHGRYTNPDDPHSFFNCDWGHGSLMYCPGDLVYRESQPCDCCDYPTKTY
ncbi:hypothetical protein NQD34_005676 [Periophthalmus magnuspinnatus]|nr:hypothetical protein NQD34_005676 [Periophthalmus magnuspinnatus]